MGFSLGFIQQGKSAGIGTDPLSIFGSSLAAWYKADVGLSLTGTTITAVADQSGKGVNLTASADATVFAATGFNGKPTMKFNPTNASNHGSLLISGTSALALGGNSAVFCVINWRAKNISAGNNWVVAFLRSTGGGFPWNNAPSIVWATTRNNQSMAGVNNSIDLGNFTFSLSTLYRFAMNADGTNFTNYLNGVQVGTSSFAQALFATGQLQLGAEVGTETQTGGAFDMSELVIVNRGATAPELAAMDTYLKNKWGL